MDGTGREEFLLLKYWVKTSAASIYVILSEQRIILSLDNDTILN